MARTRKLPNEIRSDCGTYLFIHGDEPGTRWHTVHIPTGWWINASTGGIGLARAQVKWDDGLWLPRQLRDDLIAARTHRPDDAGRQRIERAWAWLEEHHPELLEEVKAAAP